MTAPVPSTRITPTGRMLGDGHRTYISFASNPDLAIWEMAVTPPGFKVDGPNDTSTQHNHTVRTFSPGALITVKAITVTANYDPAVYPDLLALVGKRDTVTVHWPDGSALAAYAYLEEVTPGAAEQGKKPDMTLVIQVTNTDPLTCSEEIPVFVAGSGTSATC